MASSASARVDVTPRRFWDERHDRLDAYLEQMKAKESDHDNGG